LEDSEIAILLDRAVFYAFGTWIGSRIRPLVGYGGDATDRSEEPLENRDI
jgi:hypothetical protein